MPEKTNYMLLGTHYGNAKYVESVPANRDIGYCQVFSLHSKNAHHFYM